MSAGEVTTITTVLDAEKKIETASHGSSGIDEKEITGVQEATDFLATAKLNNDLKGDVEKITNKFSHLLTLGITKYFRGGGETADPEKIKDLTPAQITAYNDVINFLLITGKDTTMLSDDRVHLTDIQTALNAKTKADAAKVVADAAKAAAETQEKIDEGDSKLFDILTASPTETQAQTLFGDVGITGKPARDAIFANVKGETFDIDQTRVNTIQTAEKTTYSEEAKMESNFTELIRIYAKVPKDALATDVTIKVITSTGADNYDKDVKYININYTKDKVNIIDKDIMFGSTTDILHQARADHLDKDKLNGFKAKFQTKDTGIADGLKAIDKLGAHCTLERLIDEKYLNITTDLLDKGIFAGINTYYNTEQAGKKPESRENDYYAVITDLVVKDAKAGDVALLQTFLESATVSNIKYLGTTAEKQLANCDKLKALIDSPSFDKTSATGKDIIGKVALLRAQVVDKVGWKETAEKGVDAFFKAFGKSLIGVLEYFGGKGCVKDFFESMGLSDFYEKNLKSIDDNINKLYKEKYELSTAQKTALEDVVGKDTAFNFDAEKFTDFSSLTLPAIDTKIDNFAKEKNSKETSKTNQSAFIDKMKTTNNFKLIDPEIVYMLVKNTDLDSKEANGVNGKALVVSDYVTQDSDGNRQLNENLTTNETMRTNVLNRLFDDKTTWTTIKESNYLINGVETTKNAKTTYSRSDLDVKAIDGKRDDIKSKEARSEYSISSDKDIATYLTAYAFAGSKKIDYVITESKLSHDAIKEAAVVPETPETIKANLSLTYDEKEKTYTYKTSDGKETLVTGTNEAELKIAKETLVKADLKTINDAAYSLDNYKYVFLNDDDTNTSPYSLLTADLKDNTTPVYGKILTQDKIKSFLTDMTTESTKTTGKYYNTFDFGPSSDATKALTYISTITAGSFTTKYENGSIKISGKDTTPADVSFVLEDNLENFEKAKAVDVTTGTVNTITSTLITANNLDTDGKTVSKTVKAGTKLSALFTTVGLKTAPAKIKITYDAATVSKYGLKQNFDIVEMDANKTKYAFSDEKKTEATVKPGWTIEEYATAPVVAANSTTVKK